MSFLLTDMFSCTPGCDTTSALVGAGKQKPWAALCRSENHQENLAIVGKSPVLGDVCRQKCEEFICSFCPAVKKAARSADEPRYMMFCQKKTQK